jgi:hypothetical protein
MKSHRDNSYNEHFIKEILSIFDLISSILLITAGLVLWYFTPFLGSLIRIFGVIFLLLNGLLLFLAGLGFLKFRKWSMKIHYLSWIMVLLIFPIGTLYGAFTLWISSKVNQ